VRRGGAGGAQGGCRSLEAMGRRGWGWGGTVSLGWKTSSALAMCGGSSVMPVAPGAAVEHAASQAYTGHKDVGCKGAFGTHSDATPMWDRQSHRAPTPGLGRHTGCPVIIQPTPVPPTALCPLPGSLAMCLRTRVVPRCHGRANSATAYPQPVCFLATCRNLSSHQPLCSTSMLTRHHTCNCVTPRSLHLR
jgi:hypothetical protein